MCTSMFMRSLTPMYTHGFNFKPSPPRLAPRFMVVLMLILIPMLTIVSMQMLVITCMTISISIPILDFTKLWHAINYPNTRF